MFLLILFRVFSFKEILLLNFSDAPQINITYQDQTELHFKLDANPPANFEILFESNSRNEPINKRINTFKILNQENTSTRMKSYIIRFPKLSEQEMGNYLIMARNSINTTYGEFKLQCKLFFEFYFKNNLLLNFINPLFSIQISRTDCIQS